MRAALLLLLTGCTTLRVVPCSDVTQPATRFACSQLPACRTNCAVTVVNTEGGAAPQTIAPDTTQHKGVHIGATNAGPIP